MKNVLKDRALVFVGFRHKTDAVLAARNAGYKTILLTHQSYEKAKGLFDQVIALDLKNAQAILNVLPEIKSKYRVRGVLTNYDHFVVLRSFVAEYLGVPTTSVYAASCTRNKALQRHALEFLPENLPSRRVTNLVEARKAWEELGKDCFVKNIAGVKSKLVFHVENEAELEAAVKSMMEGSKIEDPDLCDAYEFMNFHFLYPNPNEVFLVEKAAKGRGVSVASIVGSRKIWHSPSVLDTITASELGRDDSFIAYRMLPSNLNADLIKKIKKVVSGAIRILGLKNCAVHTEVMVDDDGGVALIEIASRMGGYRHDMYMHAYDLDLSERLLKAAIGGEIKTRKKHKNVVSMMEFFAENEGKYLGFSAWDKSMLPEGVKIVLEKNAEVGEMVGPAKLGYPPAYRMLLVSDKYKSLDALCREIFEQIVIDVA